MEIQEMLNSFTSFINLVIVGICLCVGWIIKNLIPNDKINRFIPLIMGCLGVVCACTMNRAISVEIIFSGLISGLASTGVYEAYKDVFKKYIGNNGGFVSVPFSKGFDISSYQDDINISTLKANGDFIILRAGFTGYGGDGTSKRIDKSFEKFYKQAKECNMPVGAYWYSCADTADKGRAEAEYMYNNCLKGKQFEYPIYIDIEETRWQTNKKDGVTDAAIAFCDWLEKKGYFVGVYASDISGFKDKMHIDRLKPYALWVARYNGQPSFVKEFGIHQDTSTYRINGYDGALDHNICYVDYPTAIKVNGLNGFSKSNPTVTPPPTQKPILDGFLPSKGYWTRGDKDERIGKLAKFMRKNFPAYTSALALGNLYGKNIEKSIKEFQRRTGLETDGNCGPKTYAKLKEYGFKP